MIRKRLAKILRKLADKVGGPESFDDLDLSEFHKNLDKVMEAYEQEAERRDELGLLDLKPPVPWRDDFYLRQGYRVQLADCDTQGHWQGGQTTHEGAVCPTCDRPLLLFWDINTQDSRFKAESADVFGRLARLPLYYCCHHPEPTIYQVVADNRIQTIRPEHIECEESPFEKRPAMFDRRPLELIPIPRTVELLLIASRAIAFEWLSGDEIEAASRFLQKEINGRWDLAFSQFGGVPQFLQGNDPIDCPNPECKTHRMGHPQLRNKRQYQLKDLAVIAPDGKLETDSACTQINIRFCWECHTIHAAYSCD